MFPIIHLLATFIADLFKSRRRLEVENLFLRHQLNVVLRRAPQRVRIRAGDRALMVWMTRMWPSLLGLTELFNQPPSCGGIDADLGLTGAGNLELGQAGPGRVRVARSHPADERGESIVGRSANSWRTAEAWVQGRRVDSLQVHDATPRTAIADPEDIPAQSRGGHCSN
jgi:hypothetical protein